MMTRRNKVKSMNKFNVIFGDPDSPRFDSEEAAAMFACRYVPKDEPLSGAAIARAARKMEDICPVTAARLERAARVAIFGPEFIR